MAHFFWKRRIFRHTFNDKSITLQSMRFSLVIITSDIMTFLGETFKIIESFTK